MTTESEVIQIDKSVAHRKTYKMRRVSPNSPKRKTIETFLPAVVVETAARRHRLGIQDFLEQYSIQFLYDGIEGGFFQFVKNDEDDR